MSGYASFGGARTSCGHSPSTPRQGPDRACAAGTPQPDVRFPFRFNVSLSDAALKASEGGNGMLRAVRGRMGGSGDSDHILYFVVQLGPYPVPGMERALYAVANYRYWNVLSGQIQWQPNSVTQDGRLAVLECSLKEATLYKDFDALCSNPASQQFPAAQPQVLRVLRTSYQLDAVRAGDTKGLFTSPFAMPAADYLARLDSNGEALFACVIALTDIAPVFKTPASWNPGQLIVQGVMGLYEEAYAAELYSRITPAMMFGLATGADAGTMTKYSALTPLGDVSSGTAQLNWPMIKSPLFISSGHYATATRGFQFGAVACALAVLGRDVAAAVKAFVGLTDDPSTVAPYLKITVVDGADPSWLTELAADQYTTRLGAVYGSDGVALAESAMVVSACEHFDPLSFLPQPDPSEGGLVPNGQRRSIVVVINGNLFVQAPGVGQTGDEVTWGGGFSPSCGGLAAEGCQALEPTGPTGIPSCGTLLRYRELLPGPARVGGFLDTLGMIAGTVVNVAGAVAPVAGALVKAIVGSPPGARPAHQKMRFLKDGDEVQTQSTAVSPQGELSARTVGSPAAIPQDPLRLFVPNYDANRPDIFNATYTTVGNLGPHTAFLSLDTGMTFNLRMFVAERDCNMTCSAASTPGKHGKRQPAGRELVVDCPNTAATLKGEVVGHITFVHTLNAFDSVGPALGYSPTQSVMVEVFRQAFEAPWVSLFGTPVEIQARNADGAVERMKAGAIAIVNEVFTVSKTVTIPPPQGYTGPDGVYHDYQEGDKIALGAVFGYHIALAPEYAVQRIQGATAQDKVFLRPADLAIGLAPSEFYNMTGDVGSAVVSDPHPDGAEAWAEFNTTRRCQVNGTLAGAASTDSPLLQCSQFRFSVGNVDRRPSTAKS
jgi:hypothetical protein